MLNPTLDKYVVDFNGAFFNNEIGKKYDNFLFHMNGPIKNIKDLILESIQLISIPGYNLNLTSVENINNMKNTNFNGVGNRPNNFTGTTINRQYAGNANLQSVTDSQNITITFRNVLINWMYIYEIFYNYYKRDRNLTDFNIIITLHDAAEIPLMNFVFKDCFTSLIPGLEFAFNSQFREAKTFDAGFAFNGLSTNFLIPEFNVKKLNLKY